ncbi:hypothetical protein BH11PSE11_BH11PSE11_08040 [soil metagenome]
MKRRTLIKAAIAGGAGLAVGGAGMLWLRAGRSEETLSVEAALDKIDWLSARTLQSAGEWSPHQVFSHCAQSIEYSMTGYPASRSHFFQSTAGALAFSVFSARQKMSHGLSEPILGAPVLERKEDFQDGLARLRAAFVNFQGFKGPLKPHFAYGELNRHEYELAHVMHFWNHLQQIRHL